ncbi:hypothetical protein J0695_16465 [Streptomyces beijiangensis]|uniref:Glycosyltransferase RgtA/B/C/D-like domain-containing protein n=1 Tax=Streptomyces beijiangensis TaxID=163361 RepID=A0A939F7A3_9ACTN|nr:hypothetical protein [Streptomyces beijiangensis]MBO0513382.1 hypothetical protein [Streptomyces beijiangensis]
MLRRAAPALGLFAAVRLAGLVVLALWSWHLGHSPLAVIGDSWDSRWYTSIAAHGYGARTFRWPGGDVQSDLAFFPLYPALIKVVTTVLPVTGGGAGLLVSWAGAAAAACGIYAVGERLYGRRAATLLVLLWGLLPHAVVLSMAYTEPVLTAFAAWSLYALLSRHWLWAGSLALLAGLSRPNGYAVAAAVCVAALCEAVRGRATTRVWAAGLLAPLGWAGFVLWVGARKGDLLGGYFAVQDKWGSRFDFGAGWLRLGRDLLLRPAPVVLTVSMLIVAAAVLLYVLLALERPPLPLLIYTGALLLVAVGGTGFFESKPRFLLPAFPLLIPLALAMTKARPKTAIVVITALAGLSFGFGAYLLTSAHMPL